MSFERIAPLTALLLLGGALAACNEPADAGAAKQTEVVRWKLPKALKEISGLAFLDGQLYAHQDERVRVYALDWQDGRVLDTYPAGDQGRGDRGDVEGIAALDGRLYLVTSDGQLYRTAPETRVIEHVRDLGTDESCEIEGLTAVDGGLVAACKSWYGEDDPLGVHFLRWEADGEVTHVAIPLTGDLQHELEQGLSPSGIEFVAGERIFLLVAAREGRICELDAALRFRRCSALDGSHKQTEGVAVAPSGAVVLADEGRGGRARLTVYPDRTFLEPRS